MSIKNDCKQYFLADLLMLFKKTCGLTFASRTFPHTATNRKLKVDQPKGQRRFKFKIKVIYP